MTINYKEIAEFYESEFKRYTQAMDAGTLTMVDRIDPRYRVSHSDLTAKFPELLANVDHTIAVQPFISKAIRSLKRQKLWR